MGEVLRAILCVSDAPEYVICVGSQDIRFEMHRYCGPMPINKDGSEKQLGPKHKFWTAVSRWAEQGQKVENGRALYR